MEHEIKVISFNVLYRRCGRGRRFKGVARTILGEMPDSFGLQEAHARWKLLLNRELGGLYGIACQTGRFAGLGESVPVYYLKDKYELAGEGVFWLSETPRRTSWGWDAVLPRVVGYAVLRDRETGFSYAHFNTHFDHKGKIAKVNSARLTADRIAELGLPAVLTGDLNAGPGSPTMQQLEAGGLTDLRFAAAETDHGVTHHGYRGCTGVIDYVLANHFLRGAGEFKVIRDEYDGMYPSDHFAVCAKLTLAN